MADELNHKKILRKYLLGELSDDEAEQVERQLMTDSAYAEEASILEDELVEEYFSGELSVEDRIRFQSGYLSSAEGRQHLDFEAAFRKLISNASLQTPPEGRQPSGLLAGIANARRFSRAASVLGALLLLLITGYLWIRIHRDNREASNAKSAAAAEEQTRTPDKHLAEEPAGRSEEEAQGEKASHQETQTPGIKKQAEPKVSVVATLLPGGVRDSGKIQEVTVPLKESSVRIKLVIPAEIHYPGYWTVLRLNGAPEQPLPGVLNETGRGPHRSVMASLASKSLTRGDYSVMLYGGQPPDRSKYVATYIFRLSKG